MTKTDNNKEIPSLTKENEKYWSDVYFTLKNYEQFTGKEVINKNSGVKGVILRITDSGSIQVLEKISPYVICTHDSWETLEMVE
jgi:hypothetical protein